MKTAAPIHFAGSQLAETRHVCAFFNNDEEEYRVLLPFIKDGFECGHKAVHVVNPHQRSEHFERLVAAGINPAAAERTGQFELRTNRETYLRDGAFDKDRMLEAFEQIASGNAPGAFPLSRIVCRMDWAAEEQSCVNDLIEFESRVNHVWERHDDAVICTYLRSSSSAAFCNEIRFSCHQPSSFESSTNDKRGGAHQPKQES